MSRDISWKAFGDSRFLRRRARWLRDITCASGTPIGRPSPPSCVSTMRMAGATLDELNERLDQTFAAKTRADLNTVMRDLPYAAQPGVGVGGSGWAGPPVRAHGDAVRLGLPRRPGSAGTSRAVHRVRAPDGACVGLRLFLAPSSCSASVAGNGRSRLFCSSRRWRCSGGCSGSGGGAEWAAGAAEGAAGDRAASDSAPAASAPGRARRSLRGEVVGLANHGSR